MNPFSNVLRHSSPIGESLCPRALQFSTTSVFQSGHNRWSKIKHDKGSADTKKTLQRSAFSKEIAYASKLYGGDPNTNFRLAAVLSNAKKVGLPKSIIESAIARGQGKSSSGAALESVTLEVLLPPKVAMIIESETDNRARILGTLRHLVKTHGCSVSPTSYLFRKKGRVIFKNCEHSPEIDDMLEDAIEAGADDVGKSEDGNTVVWTEPNNTMAMAEALQNRKGLEVQSSEIIWHANEDTIVQLEDGDVLDRLVAFIESVRESSSVQGIFVNVAQGRSSEEVWSNLRSQLDM